MLAQRYKQKMLKCNKNNYKSTKRHFFPIRHLVGSYVGYFFRRLYIYIYIYIKAKRT